MKTVAHTILQQLGGNKFVAMTGARDFVSLSHVARGALQFRLPGRRINSVVVRLDDNDTYTVSFNRRFGVTVTRVASESFVHADQLRAVFESHTGLATSL